MGPGKRIAALREARGWSQAELARRSGVAQTTISRLEIEEKAGASGRSIVRLAEVFGVSPSHLLRGDESEQVVPTPRYDFWDAQREIPPDAPDEARHAFAQMVKDQARLFFRSGGLLRPSRNGDGAGEKSGATAVADDPSQDGYFKTDYRTFTIDQDSPRYRPSLRRLPILVPAG